MKPKILTTILLSCLFASKALAQATVTSMTETMDFIAGDDQRRDYNNKLCALVKVQVLDEITEVEGNTMGDIVNRGVEKWVYMAQDSRNMKIHLKNNLPLTVKFKDHNITSLKSNRVYLLVIDVPNKGNTVGSESLKGNNLQLRVTPQNATITIWGDDLERKTYRPQDDGTLNIYLPYGRYHYQAIANGYHDKEGSVFVNDEDRWDYINLDAITGTLSINCPTDKSEFYINKKLVTKSKKSNSWSGEMTPGSYIVEVIRDGFVSQSKTIDVVANQTTVVNFEELVTLAEQKRTEAKNEQMELKRKQQEELLRKQEEQQRLEREKAEREAERQKKLAAEREQAEKERQAAREKRKAIRDQKAKEQEAIVFGVRAGVNLATVGMKGETEGSTSMSAGFHVGANADVKLTYELHLNAGLLFSQKGYEFKGKGYEEKTTAQFITIPVQLSYRINMFQINLGPYLDFGLGGDIDYKEGKIGTFEHFDKMNYGVTFGAGVILGKNFYIGANYECGMSNYANRNIAISLGYNF